MILLCLFLQIGPMISDKLKTDLEKFEFDHAAKFEAVQTDYFAAHGKYWQGIETPATLPDEGTKEKDPDLTKKPQDQVEKWEDVFKGAELLPSKWPATMRCDVYEGPLGLGWVLTLAVSEGGIRWQRSWNYGPEKWREDKDWREITPLVIP